MLEIFDKSRKRIAIAENASGVEEERKINSLWYLTFSLPYNDAKNEYCQPFNYVRYNGGELYRIMPVDAEIAETGLLTYQCEHVLATLIDNVLFGYHVVGNRGTYTADCIRYVLNRQRVQNWVLYECDFARQFEYGWTQETLLSALFSIATPLADYMWVTDTSVYPWRLSLKSIGLGQKPQLYVRSGWNMLSYCFIYTFGLELGMAMTFQPKKGAGAGCTYSMGYYKKAGRFFKDPQPGDQIFFTNDGGASSYHTGLVEKVEGGRVYTIEGNTSSAPGVVPNGGAVRDKSYSLGYNQIAGYGRPDWSLAGEETEEMTQDQFNDMFKVAMAAYRAELQDNDCGSYSAEGRQFMIDKGLMVGGNPLPNGEPNYMWQDFLTREQFATVLFRYAKALGIA